MISVISVAKPHRFKLHSVGPTSARSRSARPLRSSTPPQVSSLGLFEKHLMGYTMRTDRYRLVVLARPS